MKPRGPLLHPPVQALPRVNHFVFFGLDFFGPVASVGTQQTARFFLDSDNLQSRTREVTSSSIASWIYFETKDCGPQKDGKFCVAAMTTGAIRALQKVQSYKDRTV